MNTNKPAAVAYPQIATIVPSTGTTRQPANRVAHHTDDQIATGHYGPLGHKPEGIGKPPGASSESRDLGHNAQVTFDVAHYVSLPEDRRRLALVTLTHLVYHAGLQAHALGATRRALVFAEKEATQKRRDTGFRARAAAVFLARAEALL